MNLRTALAIFHCLLALALAACGHSGSSSGNTNLRIVNAIPDVAAVSVTVGTQSVVTNLPFQGLTQYTGVQSGNQEFKVSANGGASNAIDVTIGLSSGANYTYVLFNPVASANGLIVSDSNFPSLNSGTFGFRVINAAAGVGLVDVYLTPPGTDINSTSPTVSGVAVGAVSPAIAPNAATLELRVTAAGTKQILFDTAAQNFANGANYEIVVYTVGSGTLVNVAFLNVDTNGTGQTESNLLANFKVLNASQVASPLNVSVDGNLTLSNVPFAAVSNYVTIANGNHSFTVQATATPGANLLTLQASLAAATDTSIVLNGAAGGLVGTVLTDNNLPPPAGRAHIRFVNSSPDLGPLDVYINFSKQVSGLGTNAASGYNEVTADTTLGTAFEFDFNLAGTTTPVLKMANTTIIGGHVYSIYVIGLSTGLQGVVVKDH